jgi:MFS family permease
VPVRTICIAINGVAPWLWIPLANKYGRRPIYLFTTLLGFASILGAAYAQTWAQLLVARVFNGFFPIAFALGAVTVVDLFFFHQRGRAMGVYTVSMVNGNHLAPIVGGLVGQYLGWRWIFKLAAILDGAVLVLIFFCMPETLYVRHHQPRVTPDTRRGYISKATYLKGLRLWSHHPELKLRANQFVLPSIKMAKYPSVIFPAIYYATQYGFGSILPAVTVTVIFSEFFKWNTLDIGLGYGLALTIGGSLGELAAGWVVDYMVKRERRKLGGRDPEPESRLKAIWTGEILVPAGLLIYGFCLQYHTVWIAPLLGIGIAAFGVQVITTTIYTYSIDCYRPEGSEVAQLINFFRQEFGMTFAFYALRLAERIGYQFTFLFFAICGGVLAFIPILGLMWTGKEWRERLGKPQNVNAFDSRLPGEILDAEGVEVKG